MIYGEDPQKVSRMEKEVWYVEDAEDECRNIGMYDCCRYEDSRCKNCPLDKKV